MPARVIGRRSRAVRDTHDAGITLMELLVAMVINLIIGTLTVSIFLAVNNSSNNSVDRAVSTANARNTIQAWTALLRVADGKTAGVVTNRIEWLTSKDMLFYADLKNRSTTNLTVTGAPTMVWLRLDSSNVLIQEQFPSTATAGTAPSVCLRLAGTVSTPAAPLFTPFDATGASMTGLNLGTAPTAAAGCRPLPVTVPSQSSRPDLNAQANLQKVVSVQIDFVVRDTKGQHPIEFTSQAVLPALGGV
jgi:Tfp pilus assembly protein PilW